MEKIWKYEIELTDTQEIEMPRNAKILSCQMQWSNTCIWAKVETGNRMETVTIDVIGTGNPISEFNREFIDTIQLNGGALVFHVFKRLED
jgi:hypothetical protein